MEISQIFQEVEFSTPGKKNKKNQNSLREKGGKIFLLNYSKKEGRKLLSFFKNPP